MKTPKKTEIINANTGKPISQSQPKPKETKKAKVNIVAQTPVSKRTSIHLNKAIETNKKEPRKSLPRTLFQ